MPDLSIFQIVTLKHRHLHFGLIGGRAIIAFGGKKPHGSITVDRLDVVMHDAEGLSADGKTLRVGALGIILIIDHLATMQSYANSPRQLHKRLFRLLAGSAHASAMVAATCRAAFSHPGVGGDTGMYLRAATRQLESWSTDTVDVEVCRPF
jgi:hypothetical protein